MVGCEVRGRAAHTAVVAAACGSPGSPPAKCSSPPEAELHVTLTEGLLLGEEGTVYLVCSVFAACCLENYLPVQLNETFEGYFAYCLVAVNPE